MTKANIKKCILPLSVVLVVGMILFPLPYFALDLLLASNLAFSVVLLLTALFISEPDKFTSLPSILLLSTLFRLGLNISSTRVILSGGEIPQMIVSFGQFVVAGSMVVGFVVFSIISIVQFIVISKGTERVAEVAARFALDALPGKQMSIDADMRAGLLSLADARQKRKELHRESKLYGALDGAMKFVKGDAIVGLCIIFVNIVAGFLLGVVRDSLSVLDALNTYALLTIGDALVSQVPAVLVSISAGIVVTRVSDREDASLSDDIGSQMTKEPISLLVTSFVLFIFALIPGLPFLPLIFCSLFSAYLCKKKFKDIDSTSNAEKNVMVFKPRVLPVLMLKLSAKAASQLQAENRILNYFDALRSVAFEEKGIVIPDLSFDIDPKSLNYSAEISLHGVVYKTLLFDSLSYDQENDPLSRSLGVALKEIIDKKGFEFVTNQHTRCLLDMYDNQIGELVRNFMPSCISISTLTMVCRELLEDGFSIRDFSKLINQISYYVDYKQISGSMHKSDQRDLEELITKIRKSLFVNNSLKIEELKGKKVFVLDQEVESSLISLALSSLPPRPDIAESLRELIESSINLQNNGNRIILLVSYQIRRMVKNMLLENLDRVQVYAFEDLPESLPISIEILGGVENREAA